MTCSFAADDDPETLDRGGPVRIGHVAGNLRRALKDKTAFPFDVSNSRRKGEVSASRP